MKNKKGIIVLIILLSILMVVFSLFFVGLLKNNFKIKNFKWGLQISNELILDKTYEEDFKKIIIDSSTSQIYIKTSETNKVKALIYGDKDSTEVEVKEDTLNIKSNDKPCFGICFTKKQAKIEIYLPESYNGDIDIKNDYGDIFVDKFLNANMSLEEDAGDVKILGSNMVEVSNSYGDIEIEKVNIANILEDCGDVIISQVNEVTVKNNYGDIKIKSVENYLNLEDDCGDIEVNKINLIKNSYIKNDYGDIKLGDTNEIFIEAKTDLGKIKIKNNYHKSDIILEIENDCGDIVVNN